VILFINTSKLSNFRNIYICGKNIEKERQVNHCDKIRDNRKDMNIIRNRETNRKENTERSNKILAIFYLPSWMNTKLNIYCLFSDQFTKCI
jgi:hypothetical protein